MNPKINKALYSRNDEHKEVKCIHQFRVKIGDGLWKCLNKECGIVEKICQL